MEENNNKSFREYIYEPKSIVNKNKKNKTDKTVNQNKDTKDCEKTPNPVKPKLSSDF